MSDRKLADVFPSWRNLTVVPTAVTWTLSADWEDPTFLDRLLDTIEDELEARFRRSPEDLSEFGAAVLKDLVDTGQEFVAPIIDIQKSFVRFFLAVKLVEYCQMFGRTSLAFDWLLCAVSNRPWEFVESGQALEVDYYPARLRQFVNSMVPVIRGTSQWAVIAFLRCLYYYSWKSGGLRELAEIVVDDGTLLVRGAMKSNEAELVEWGVEAASAMATWCVQGEHHQTTTLVQSMLELYFGLGVSEKARKLIAVTLATSIADHVGQNRVAWARRAVTEHATLLTQHETVHMLVASCATPEEMAERYDEIIEAVNKYTAVCDNQVEDDRAEIALRRTQLFAVLAPFVIGLIRVGQCSKAVNAAAAWFSVPTERRRKSPVVALVAGHIEGAIYAVDGHALVVKHDSVAAHRRLIEAVNHAFDTNIVIRDDHDFLPRPRTGRREKVGRQGDELAEATAAYYGLEQAADEIKKTQGLSLFLADSVRAPLVPLVRSRLRVTWPTITSYEEPATDRPVRRALIWSYGTMLGEREAQAVATILRASGIECVLLANRQLTPNEFLDFYNDNSFDLVWVSAHGMFDAREPQRARIEISSDKSNSILLTDLIRYPICGPGRRLLFLNICLGASVVVTEAPPKLGLAAMLASAEQAVVSHIVEVSSFVAPLFGIGAAISLAKGESFLTAFGCALDAVRLERSAALELVSSSAPNCEDFLNWLRTGTYGVEQDDIRTWGTGAFYE